MDVIQKMRLLANFSLESIGIAVLRFAFLKVQK